MCCPKCRNPDTPIRYCNGMPGWPGCQHGAETAAVRKEHMHRRCGNCGFGWNEEPADAQAPEASPFASVAAQFQRVHDAAKANEANKKRA